jgi:hypothetical protein
MGLQISRNPTKSGIEQQTRQGDHDGKEVEEG